MSKTCMLPSEINQFEVPFLNFDLCEFSNEVSHFHFQSDEEKMFGKKPEAAC